MTEHPAAPTQPQTFTGRMLAVFLRGLLPEATHFEKEIAQIEAEARAAARKEVERGLGAHRYSWVANTADDWKCSCGYFGNFSWSGWALHFLGASAVAALPEGEGHGPDCPDRRPATFPNTVIFDPPESQERPQPNLIEHHEHWRFFADHPLPWELFDTSAGFAVEDANHEVLWRFDHYDRADVERFVASLNDVVSVEEAPYIRGYNRGWDDVRKEPSLAFHEHDLAQERPPIDVERARQAFEIHDMEHHGIGGLHPESCDEWIATEYLRLSGSSLAAPPPTPRKEVLTSERVKSALIDEGLLTVTPPDSLEWGPAVTDRDAEAAYNQQVAERITTAILDSLSTDTREEPT